MAKLKIEELKYIVMEGGGARGTAYLGAVKALEDQLKELVEKNPKKYKLEEVSKDREGGCGIMDCLKIDGDKEIPVIEGVAGASAGAITTFALVLGLNSQEIEKDVMSYSFKKFLKETDPGVYRMIDENSNLAIGGDKKLRNGFYSKTLLGGKKSSFEYQLDKDRTTINGDLGKGLKRFFFVNLILKIIIDGVLVNLQQLSSAFDSNIKKDGPSWLSKFWNWFVVKSERGNPASNSSNPNQFIGSSTFSMGVSAALFARLSYKYKFKITPNTVSSIFLDRGLYSGFQVREFFYDLLLCAVTRDTFFQRKLIDYYKKTFNIDFDKNLLINKFIIGERKQYYMENVKNNNELKDLFEFLMNLTFIELYQILGVDFCVSVSNFTSGSPLYFSYSFTPHFRVLEAVAASMSIPPAIRPVYNESNVIVETDNYNVNVETANFNFIVKTDNDSNFIVETGNYNGNKSIIDRIKTDENKNLPFYSNGKFDKNKYSMYEQAVKSLLHSNMDDGNYVDLNNKIDLSNFMFKFRDLVIGSWDNNQMVFTPEPLKDPSNNEFSEKQKVTPEILRYFYNSLYKGMLMDGGYLNNIPYNYFREKNKQKNKGKVKSELINKMDGILALKLDNSFPTDFMDNINTALAKYIKIENELRVLISKETEESQKLEYSNQLDQEFEKIICIVKSKFSVYFSAKESTLKDRKAIVKIIEKWLDEYGESNNIPPWATKKSILATAMEGYSYGTERGQIRDISDHNHIIPLYDFGVGVYDFDMSKIQPMIELAKQESEKHVNDFFKKIGEKVI